MIYDGQNSEVAAGQLPSGWIRVKVDCVLTDDKGNKTPTVAYFDYRLDGKHKPPSSWLRHAEVVAVG
jgi:hypothetical protein